MLQVLRTDDNSLVANQNLVGGADVRTLRAGEPLAHEGDAATDVFEVTEGIIRVYKIFSDGSRQIFSFAFPGTILGLGNRETYGFGYDALVFSRVRVVPRARFLSALWEYPELGAKALDAALDEVSDAHYLSAILCRKAAIAKVAAFLCSLTYRLRSLRKPGTLILPMTRSDIADYLGLSIETVSRCITRLRDKGIISLPNSGVVVINDVEGLEHIGDCHAEYH